MRLFFAIDFTHQLKDELSGCIAELKRYAPLFNWVRRDALHLTIKFLGEVDTEKLDLIKESVNNAFSEINVFDLESTNPGFFPNKRNPRVYFLGLLPSEQLTRVFSVLEDKMQKAGYEKEKRNFHPHITLCRIKERVINPDILLRLENYKFNTFRLQVDQIILLQSTLTPTGARYTPVQKFSLRA